MLLMEGTFRITMNTLCQSLSYMELPKNDQKMVRNEAIKSNKRRSENHSRKPLNLCPHDLWTSWLSMTQIMIMKWMKRPLLMLPANSIPTTFRWVRFWALFSITKEKASPKHFDKLQPRPFYVQITFQVWKSCQMHCRTFLWLMNQYENHGICW